MIVVTRIGMTNAGVDTIRERSEERGLRTLTLDAFEILMRQMRPFAAATGRTVASRPLTLEAA